jgi:hypothetical protein
MTPTASLTTTHHPDWDPTETRLSSLVYPPPGQSQSQPFNPTSLDLAGGVSRFTLAKSGKCVIDSHFYELIVLNMQQIHAFNGGF